MPPVPISYPLDITGQNAGNRIIDEQHTLLGNGANRVVVPNFSPFFPSSFAGSLVVTDTVSGLPLTRGTDFQIVEFSQELTLRYGKEIASAIIVSNPAIADTVRLSYQTIGGYYTNNTEAIARLYESVITDDRPVAWENILNKPAGFTPTDHPHLLDDVFGFEVLVEGLERIKRAITIGQTGLAIEIVKGLFARFNFGELEHNIPTKRLVTYDALLAVLSRSFLLSNLSIEFISGVRYKGNSFSVEIKTNDPSLYNQLVYLSVQGNKANTALIAYSPANPNNVDDPNHIRLDNNGRAEVYFYITTDETLAGDNLYIGVRRSLSRPDFDAVTYDVDARERGTVLDYYARRTDSSIYTLLAQIEELPPIYRFNDIATSARRGLFYRSFQGN